MALITPAVTEGSELPSRKPYGLPMAMAHSPMSRSREPPSGAVGRCVVEGGERAVEAAVALGQSAVVLVVAQRKAPAACTFFRIDRHGSPSQK